MNCALAEVTSNANKPARARMALNPTALVVGDELLFVIGINLEIRFLRRIGWRVLFWGENIELEPIFDSSTETSTHFDLLRRHIKMWRYTCLCAEEVSRNQVGSGVRRCKLQVEGCKLGSILRVHKRSSRKCANCTDCSRWIDPSPHETLIPY
jgi:hypothetical protein